MDVVIMLAGIAVLVLGGELLVQGAVSVARRFAISPLVIGLTLVGFGTSTPELVTSLEAALAGSPGIAMGNVVGSNTANILLILGLSALIAPIAVRPEAFQRDGFVLILATLACLAIVLTGSVGRVAGAGLVTALALYLAATFYFESARETPAGEVYAAEAGTLPDRAGSVWPAIGRLVIGLALTILGARFLVESAISIAAAAGVSEALIGVTIVAIGTSLPELVTSVVAARRGQAEVAFGNIVGSNIFNILGILGVTALVQPLAVPHEILGLDIWVMVGATALLIAAAWSGWRIVRGEGAVLLTAYGLYMGWLIYSAS